MTDSNATYNIEHLNDPDAEIYPSLFMQSVCSMLASTSDSNKPLVMMGIINALAYLIADEDMMDYAIRQSNEFARDMLMINMHANGFGSTQ